MTGGKEGIMRSLLLMRKKSTHIKYIKRRYKDILHDISLTLAWDLNEDNSLASLGEHETHGVKDY